SFLFIFLGWVLRNLKLFKMLDKMSALLVSRNRSYTRYNDGILIKSRRDDRASIPHDSLLLNKAMLLNSLKQLKNFKNKQAYTKFFIQ
ncbi:MAG: hypothetical protein ACTSWN_14805, partial [Promethearchaeota archaeon]